MRSRLVHSLLLLCLGVSSLAAHACGYTGGAGIEGMFSLDDPLDILILSVLFGSACALAPGLLRSFGLLKPRTGLTQQS